MNISTPFASFFASPIEGQKFVLFAHQPQHFTRLFQAVGLEIPIDRVYSKRFNCYVAYVTLSHDDFTLLTWAIEEKSAQRFFMGETPPQSVSKKWRCDPAERRDLWQPSAVEIHLNPPAKSNDSADRFPAQNCYWLPSRNVDGIIFDCRFTLSRNSLTLFVDARNSKGRGLSERPSQCQIENVALLQSSLTHCFEENQSRSAGKALSYLFKPLGVFPHSSRRTQMSATDSQKFQHDWCGFWDGSSKHLGWMARENGGFGSLCLSDCYGEESSGQERCYYDD